MFGKAHLPSVRFHPTSATTGLSLKDERYCGDGDASHALEIFAAKRSTWKLGIFGRTLMLPMAILLCVTLLKVGAGEITYKATDLSNVVPGEDLWQYEYRVNAFSFGVNQGFTIFFKVGDFQDLQSPPPPVNADWDVTTIQPDPLLPDDGFYDGLSLSASGASLADPFVLDFVWKGSGIPASQPYDIYDLGPPFAVLTSGFTVPATAVPEPPNGCDIVFMLAVTSVGGIYRARSRRSTVCPH
jgi:hypothetical protein